MFEQMRSRALVATAVFSDLATSPLFYHALRKEEMSHLWDIQQYIELLAGYEGPARQYKQKWRQTMYDRSHQAPANVEINESAEMVVVRWLREQKVKIGYDAVGGIKNLPCSAFTHARVAPMTPVKPGLTQLCFFFKLRRLSFEKSIN